MITTKSSPYSSGEPACEAKSDTSVRKEKNSETKKNGEKENDKGKKSLRMRMKPFYGGLKSRWF